VSSSRETGYDDLTEGPSLAARDDKLGLMASM